VKSIPPPLPRKTPTESQLTPTTVSSTNGDSQSAMMIGGLVAMLLVVLGLLIVIATLMRRDAVGAGQSGEMGQAAGESDSAGNHDAAGIGVEPDSPKDRESPDAKDTDSKSTPNEESLKDAAKPEEIPARSTSTASDEDKTHGVETDSSQKKPPEEVPESLPAELPPRTRVIPLFSEPSAASAPLLEASNPFLDAGEADSIVFVIDKSSSMSGRLERVLTALREAIEKLNSKQSFQLLFFDSVPYQHPKLPGLVKATKQNKAEIFAWTNSLVTASGGTDPLAAILRAIELKPDRIVVLSDGEFNPSYVEAIASANSGKPNDRIRIDCIGLDEVVESLRQIAKQNGPGIYYQAR